MSAEYIEDLYSHCCGAEVVEKFNNGMGGWLCTKCRRLCAALPRKEKDGNH